MKYHKTEERATIPLQYYAEYEPLDAESKNEQHKLLPWQPIPQPQTLPMRPSKPRNSKWSESRRLQFRSNINQLKREFEFLVDSDRKDSTSPDNSKQPRFPTQSKSPIKFQTKLSVIDCKTVQMITTVKPFKARKPLIRRKDHLSEISIKTPTYSPRFQSRLIHSSIQSQPYNESVKSIKQMPSKQSVEYFRKKQWESLHKKVRSFTQSPSMERSNPHRQFIRKVTPVTKLNTIKVEFPRQKYSINGRYLQSYLFKKIRQ